MDKEIAKALRCVERQQAALDEAIWEAQARLTDWLERQLHDLAKRYPRRKFEAWSGNGALTVTITPGPRPMYAHHRTDYQWGWQGMGGPDRYWAFLWQPWEDMCDEIAKATGLDYINLTRDLTVTGALYRDPPTLPRFDRGDILFR